MALVRDPSVDEVNEDYSNDSDIEDSGSDNSLTNDLDAIGAFPGIRLSGFWGAKTHHSDVDELHQHGIGRREQLSNFIEDLKSGFSLQSALDRFQTLRTLLESSIEETIQNNVDTDSDDEKHDDLVKNNDLSEHYEPTVIKPAVEPKAAAGLLDQMIIPESKQPRSMRTKRSKTRNRRKAMMMMPQDQVASNSEMDELTLISKDDKNNEKLLRKRIIRIRKLSINEDEKNRLVQKLMMGTYYDNVKFVDDNGDEVFRITTEKQAETTENDELDEEDEVDEKDPEESEEDDNEEEEEQDETVIIHDEDKCATYYDDEEQILGCQHYQRNCKMECFKCKKWYCCPLCHDENVTSHRMKREETKHIMCMNCFESQEPSEFCDSCDLRFAMYYCSKCKLYDNDDSKDIYHCDDCGICRLGLGLGQDFFHCHGCNACLSIELQDDHKCIERATQSDCPICGEFMFTSTKPVVFMSCGHAIHQPCYEDHTKHSYKCPTCHKTVLNMEAEFRVLDMEISLHPLPQPYCNWTCIITCNDCNAKSSCAYHVLGLKCDNCKSYNTFQKKLIKPEEHDDDSDVSSTTNQRGTSTIRNLRNISMMNSNRLNTNYLINEELNSSSASHINEHTNDKDDKRPNTLSDTEADKTLTLPQQLLNNIDEYLANIEFQSSDEEDEEDDEVDFLRLNRTLKHMKNSDILSDTDKSNDGNPNTTTNDSNRIPSNFFTNAIRDFLKSGNNDKSKDN